MTTGSRTRPNKHRGGFALCGDMHAALASMEVVVALKTCMMRPRASEAAGPLEVFCNSFSE